MDAFICNLRRTTAGLPMRFLACVSFCQGPLKVPGVPSLYFIDILQSSVGGRVGWFILSQEISVRPLPTLLLALSSPAFHMLSYSAHLLF